MNDFEDVYLTDKIRRYPWTSSPRTSTTITQVASGHEHRNRNWIHPLHKFTAPEAIQCHDDLEDVKDTFLAFGGPLISFPLRDPIDFASVRLTKANLVPSIGPTDQTIGIGDDVTTDFQLLKTYTRGTRSYVRRITLPVVSTVVVYMNALPLATADPVLPGGPYTFTVDRLTGIVSIDPAPEDGNVVTAGFLFDVPVRFEGDDSFDAIVESFEVSGNADLTLVEVRPCTGGDSE